ncbi:MAG: FAD:protein FMN transferase [Oscillospiraceae bacterium]|nr:FAD:protein FMN transferase [Oscillospiraceae bacterium]
MKRFLAIFLILTLLCGCTAMEPQQTQYTASFLSLFDTITSVVGRADTEEEFQARAQAVHDDLLVYHQLFDIYNEYDGLNNLKTINDQAGIAPVAVDPIIIDLLLDCGEYYGLTDGMVNPAMGSVLRLWHESRNHGLNDPSTAELPNAGLLEEAAQHMDFDCIVIDEEANTVFLTDPDMSLDLGAIAKGWATQRVAENAPTGLLISVGGNVCATGPKTSQGDPWIVGIQDPDGGENLHTIYVTGGAVVTSGDYQRVYYVEGKPYHHIIDPATRMPGEYWRSVTVVCADSGLADALSTALFLLPLEAGQALADKCDAQVLWVDGEGNEFMTPGFGDMIRT